MCVFCEIIKGNIPSSKVYEDNDVLAILDLSQITKGHTIVFPKKHYENLLDIDDEAYQKVMVAAKKVAKNIKEIYKPEGFNLVNNCGVVSGQSVPHFHVHVLPRYTEEELKMVHGNNEGKFDLNKIASEIKVK